MRFFAVACNLIQVGNSRIPNPEPYMYDTRFGKQRIQAVP